MAKSSTAETIVIDDSPEVGGGGNGTLRQILTYRGDENPNDVEVKKALLQSKMLEQLKKNSNAKVLGFTPQHLKFLIESLSGDPPKYDRRSELVAMSLQADQSGQLMSRLTNALPTRVTKRTGGKAQLANILIETFFVVDEIISSPAARLPSRHSGLGRALDLFCTDLVRVRNFASHELQNETQTMRSLKSEPITGKPFVMNHFHFLSIRANLHCIPL